MSLTIGITNPQGVVLAADSRQTYVNNFNQNRVGSDTATKIIALTPSVAVTIAGSVYLETPTLEKPYPKSVVEYINDFANGLTGSESVKTIGVNLHRFLKHLYKVEEKIEQTKQQLTKQISDQGAKILNNSLSSQEDGSFVSAQIQTADGQQGTIVAPLNNVSLAVAGYDKLGSKDPRQHLFLLNIPGSVEHRREQDKEGQYGAVWQGQTDVVMRIIKGFDPRIGNLPFMQVPDPAVQQQVQQQLDGLEYMVAWQSITLHDAIEISKLLVETSIAMQKFSSGPVIAPIDIQGIGGEVDIAVIDPIEGFGWFKSKEIIVDRPVFRQSLKTSEKKPSQH